MSDPAKLQKVYTLKKGPTPTTSMAQVQNLALSFGDNPGELDAMWKPDRLARSYALECRYVNQPGSAFVHAKVSSKSSTTLTGLTSGQAVQIRVRAIGPNELVGPWSDIAEHMVP